MFLCKVIMWMENSENKSRSSESSLIRCVYSLHFASILIISYTGVNVFTLPSIFSHSEVQWVIAFFFFKYCVYM